ncbi:MAG: hypothetical protein LBN97_00260 [Oscillospiraceae bacterium]|jgi:hypothetical protein|nr:hypothetical protein [Oscillospiraceae bacterium]
MLAERKEDAILEERVTKYFAEKAEEPTSLANLCAWLGISLDEWAGYKENPGKRLVCSRAETKLLSLLENDKFRATTIVAQMMKDYRQEADSGVKLEFVLNEAPRQE